MSVISTKMLQAAAGGGGAYWITDYQSVSGEYTYAYGVNVDSSGNILTAGYDQNGTYSGHVAKWNPDDGSNTAYGRVAQDKLRIYNVFSDSSDNVYITGWRDDGTGNAERGQLFKFNSSLAYQFGREDYSENSLYPTRVWGAAFDGTNLYIAGQTSTSNNGYFYSYDTSGTQRYTNGVIVSQNALRDVAVLGSKQYYIGQSRNSTNDPGFFFGVTDNYTANPSKHIDAGGGYYTYLSRVTARGSNIYVTGEYFSPRRAFIVKLNTSGVSIWDRQINTNAQIGHTTQIAVDSEDNVYQVFSRYNQDDSVICKLNSSGVLQWSNRLYHSSGSGVTKAIHIDGDDNILVCGLTSGAFTSGSSAFVAKLPNDGSLTGTYGDWTYTTLSLTATANGNLSITNTNQSVSSLGGVTNGNLTKSVSTASPANESIETL